LLEAKFEPAEKWAQKVVDSGQADELAKQMLQAAKEKQVSDRLRMQIAPPTAAAPVKEIVSRAWKLMNEGRRVEARKLLETELQKNPSDANAENALGWCLLNGGQPQDAKSHFQKAIQLDANAAGSMNGLARVYKAEGKDDEAVKLWQQMMDKFPGPHAGTYGLADTYLEKHDFAKALPLLEQLARANPDDPELKAKLARAAASARSGASAESNSAQFVYIGGEVTVPQQYVYTNGMTLGAALRMAKGATAFASQKVTLTQQGKSPVDFEREKIERGEAEDIKLQPGDKVFVPRKQSW
jgi:tetratricopeptide (TPR) repeat protein